MIRKSVSWLNGTRKQEEGKLQRQDVLANCMNFVFLIRSNLAIAIYLVRANASFMIIGRVAVLTALYENVASYLEER